MAENLNFGIIGCGVIAPTHIEALQQNPDVTVSWACDLIAEKAEAVAAKYGIARTTARYEEVLADPEVDAICVCTDHASHAPITVAALESGKNVLCEKALAASKDGLDSMFRAHARHPQLVFGGVFQHRFDAEYLYLKELVENNAFGQMLTASVQMRCLRTDDYYMSDQWRGTWEEEGGAVLINQTIHFVDILLWMMDGVKSVCGTHANLTHGHSLAAEDTAAAIFRFASGAVGTLEATCSSHLGWEPVVMLHGTHGSIELRDGKPVKLEFTDIDRLRAIEARFEALAKGENVEFPGKRYYGSGHLSQITDFVDAIREQRQPQVTAASARTAVEAVLAIYESSHTGKWVNMAG
jgi:predicted dehydrogenase